MLLFNYTNLTLEAGADEAGRGCLAGPVTAAAFISPNFSPIYLKNNPNVKLFLDLINDSKQLSEKIRERLKPIIEEIAVSFAVTHIYPHVIDRINILNASILGMQESVLSLNPKPSSIIIDGNAPFVSKKGFFYDFNESDKLYLNSVDSTTIIEGDSKYISIAAASVLAKTYRDEYMNEIHEEFPVYNWKKNKGYPTKEHREAILKHGLTKYHRFSFKGCEISGL